MAGTGRQDFDDILKAVARRTKQDAEIDDLGRALNIPSYDIQSAQKRNSQDHSHMGSLELLRDWVKTKTSSTMRQTLIDALNKIQREDILSVCFPEVVADSNEQQGAAGPSHPSPSSEDSSGQHGAAGPRHPPTSPGDKWKNHTVTPAKSGPDESDREMQYVMWESLKKGNALIIGNADFIVDPRPWAYMDIIHMKGVLKKLGYDSIDIHKNLSKMGMRDAVKEFTEQLKKDNPQSAVVYISSHGSVKGIAGSGGGILQIRDMLEMFSRVLPGKPKVLIIDACWGGDNTSRLPVAESSSSSGPQTEPGFPENADIFMIHSTSYGKKTWSFTTKGSWLVDELCKVVYDQFRDLEDLDTIMLRVTKGVRKIKCKDAKDGTDGGTQSTTVFKQGVDRKLFFYPGFSSTNV